MRSPNTDYLERLDHLRFVAASLVVLYHAWLLTGGAGRDIVRIALVDHGFVGVQLFMVISGFILARIAFQKEIDAPRFYLNRILRIYPLFVTVVALGYFSTLDPRPTSATIDFIVALLPVSNLSRLQYGDYGGQFWSIAVELQFYLLFPAILFWTRRRGISAIAALVAFAIVMRAAAWAAGGSLYALSYFSMFGNIDLFLAGVIAGTLHAGHGINLSNRWFAPLALVATAALIWLAGTYGLFAQTSALWIAWPTVLGFAFAITVVAYLQWPARVPLSRLTAELGKYSYSIYAWHILVIAVLKGTAIGGTAIGAFHPYLFGAIVLAVTTLLAAASYRVIELPFLQMRVNYVRPGVP
jgi:peptidoglycan/LPS O-acetylase OafA/YrhL